MNLQYWHLDQDNHPFVSKHVAGVALFCGTFPSKWVRRQNGAWNLIESNLGKNEKALSVHDANKSVSQSQLAYRISKTCRGSKDRNGLLEWFFNCLLAADLGSHVVLKHTWAVKQRLVVTRKVSVVHWKTKNKQDCWNSRKPVLLCCSHVLCLKHSSEHPVCIFPGYT